MKHLSNICVICVVDGGADLFAVIGEVEDRFSPVIFWDNPVYHLNIDQAVYCSTHGAFVQGEIMSKF